MWINRFFSIKSCTCSQRVKKYLYLRKIKKKYINNKKIKKILNKFNITTNEVTTNFLLLNFSKCKYSANYIKKKLENNGIILRSMQTYKINNALRLTIGSSSANNKLIRILNKIFRK